MNMKKTKNHLLSPNELHALSFYSRSAADSAFSSIYETALYDEKTKKSLIKENESYQYVTDNGLVNLDGEFSPYSRKPFVKNPHYACIGCSYTVSKGLPINYSWPSIVELFTGKSVNNYSEIGAGYRKIAALTLDASARFGAPKHVLALMPDPYRIWFPYSWLRNVEIHMFGYDDGIEHDDRIVFGHGYWEKTYESYMHNHMASGNSPLRLIDHKGRKHIPSPDAIAFSNMSIVYSLKKIFESMKIPFDCMTWFHPNFPTEIDSHEIFNIKRNPNLRLETSTDQADKFKQMEIQIGGDGRWRRHGASSRKDTCDHIPLTENQEKFWYISHNQTHPGLHDQIHYAEQMLDIEIPASFLMELP